MDSVAVTGASGLVATELIHLLTSKGMGVIAVTQHPSRVEARYEGNGLVECIDLEGLGKRFAEGQIPRAVVHCAFARSSRGADVASSLEYLRRLVGMARTSGLPLFINISSQSVYGKSLPPLWKESDPVDPDYLYAMGKYASELMVSMAFEGTESAYTNLRLSSVCENARFLNVFAKNALSAQPIVVQGGGQLTCFIDVRDAAAGIMSVLEKERLDLRQVYNLGTGRCRTILDLAYDTVRLAKSLYSVSTDVKIVPSEDTFAIGMDSSLFSQEFEWSPKYGYDDMVVSLLALNGGGYRLPWSFRVVYPARG